MRPNWLLCFALCLLLGSTSQAKNEIPSHIGDSSVLPDSDYQYPFQSPSLTEATRVDDLLRRMTIDQKCDFICRENGDDAASRLRGFERVAVPKGQTATADMTVPFDDLTMWDAETHCFTLKKGLCEIEIGASSEDPRLQTEIIL